MLPPRKLIPFKKSACERFGIIGRTHKFQSIEANFTKRYDLGIRIEHRVTPMVALILKSVRFKVIDARVPPAALGVVPHRVRAYADHIIRQRRWLGYKITDERHDLVHGKRNI